MNEENENSDIDVWKPGNLVVTGYDSEVSVFHGLDGTIIHSIAPPKKVKTESWVSYTIQFLSNGVIVNGNDSPNPNIFVYDIERNIQKVMTENSGWIWDIAELPGHMFCSIGTSKCDVYSSTGDFKQKGCFLSSGRSILYSSSSQEVFVGSEKQEITSFPLSRLDDKTEPVKKVIVKNIGIHCMVEIPEFHSILYSGGSSNQNKMSMIDLRTRTKSTSPSSPSPSIDFQSVTGGTAWSCVYLKNNHEVVEGNQDGSCVVYDLRKPSKSKKTIQPHTSILYRLRYNPEKEILYSCSMDHYVKAMTTYNSSFEEIFQHKIVDVRGIDIIPSNSSKQEDPDLKERTSFVKDSCWNEDEDEDEEEKIKISFHNDSFTLNKTLLLII